jgi:hypothetical protein
MATSSESEVAPVRAVPKLLDSLARTFGPFVAVFGSGAAVGAFLVFSGFLSDFGAYRLAGLPRLNMALTSLTEQGADTVVDALSLLAGGLRGWLLALTLLVVLFVWGWHDSERLRPWARSVALYRCLRLAWLVLALLLASALIDRTQRSLSGSHYSERAVETALLRAYAGDRFPTPFDRELAIERQTYELSGSFPLVNWGVWLDERLDRAREKFGAGSADAAETEVTGIALRDLPQARRAARHTFGWLCLWVLVLCGGLLLLAWWSRWLGQEDPADDIADEGAVLLELPVLPAPAPPPQPFSALTGVAALGRLLGGRADQPLERLLSPITQLLAVVCIGLLPLAHGLLARESLGAETVMVYLDTGASDVKTVQEVKQLSVPAKPASDVLAQARSAGPSLVSSKDSTSRREEAAKSLPDSSTEGPKARLDCGHEVMSKLDEPLDTYRKAQRDLLQQRPVESEYTSSWNALGDSLNALADAAIQTACADVVGQMWAARPPLGLRKRQPAVAELFWRAFRRVQVAYGVRVGTLLGYPRDGEGLTLAVNIVPLPLARGGQSTVIEVPRTAVVESVVIPDLEGRRVRDLKSKLAIDPDSDEAGALLFAAGGEVLGIAIDFIEGRKLHANAAGVGVTQLGTISSVAALERPATATRAIDLLANLASAKPSTAWPEKSDDIRGTAVSAMHLARNPYAAHRFIEALRAEPVGKDGCSAAAEPVPLPCVPVVATAAGMVFQDIVAEMQNFRYAAPPQSLKKDRDDLASELVDIITRPDTRDDVRGAACTAIGFGGKFDAPEKVVERFWAYLRATPPDKAPFSTPGCLSQTTVIGIPRNELRPWLREVAAGKQHVAQDPNLRRLVRRTALIAMADLGLSQEDKLLFEVYMIHGETSMQQLTELAGRLFKEATPIPLAQRLLACGADGALAEGLRRHCLDGIALLHNSYDGDEGSAAALYKHLSAGRMADVKAAACGAFEALRKRNSGLIRRLPDDDSINAGCKQLVADSKSAGRTEGAGDESTKEGADAGLAALRALLEGMKEDASPSAKTKRP